MKTKRLVSTLTAGAILMTGALALALPAGATETAPPCGPAEAWPASVEGRPAARLDGEGVYLWHTDRGWRVRVTEPGADRAVFTGSVKVDGQIVSVGRHLENRGEGVVTRSGTGIASFRFVNYGGTDGLNFATRCSSTLTVRVRIDGVPVPADRIFIGADGNHPDALPTTIVKVA